MIIATVNRALNYAAPARASPWSASLGNNHEDLGKPRTDISSPDYPPGTDVPAADRQRDCVDLPVEGPHVIGVSALGPSETKADYSNYGVEQISVSAPGGWFRDGFGTPSFRANENQILSTYPRQRAAGGRARSTPAGNVTPAGVAARRAEGLPARDHDVHAVRLLPLPAGHVDGRRRTSTGVAALIVSQYGQQDGRNGGLTLKPDKTERVLINSAARARLPDAAAADLRRRGPRRPSSTPCARARPEFNGFYGHGIVDAYSAVTSKGKGTLAATHHWQRALAQVPSLGPFARRTPWAAIGSGGAPRQDCLHPRSSDLERGADHGARRGRHGRRPAEPHPRRRTPTTRSRLPQRPQGLRRDQARRRRPRRPAGPEDPAGVVRRPARSRWSTAPSSPSPPRTCPVTCTRSARRTTACPATCSPATGC